MERLERRRLLASAAFDAASKTLHVTGSDSAEQIDVAVYGNLIQVTIAGTTSSFEYAQYDIEHVKVAALGGNDVVGADHHFLVTPFADFAIDLGGGNDQFY